MAQTLMQRIVEALPFLDKISDAVQPEVQKAVDAGGTTARNMLDGVWLEARCTRNNEFPGSWTATIVFDGSTAPGKRPVRLRRRSARHGDGGAIGPPYRVSDWRYSRGRGGWG